MKLTFTPSTGTAIDHIFDYTIQPTYTPVFAGTFFAAELEKVHAPMDQISLDFYLYTAASATASAKTLFKNDENILEMLRVYKDGSIFASHDSSTVR